MLLCRKTFETTENYNSDQIGRQKEQNDELRPKTFKTTQKYESDQIQWLASIWCPNDQNYAKLPKWSNYNELHRFDVKTI